MEKAPKHDIPAVVRLTSVCLEDHRSPSMVPTDVRPATLTLTAGSNPFPMNHATGAESDKPSVLSKGQNGVRQLRGRADRLRPHNLLES